MFGYTRIFSIISLLLILTGSWFLGSYQRDYATRTVMATSRQHVDVIGTAYMQAVWKKHDDNIRRFKRLSPDKWPRYREFHELRQDTINFFKEVDGNKRMRGGDVHIYLPDGRPVLGTSGSQEDMPELNTDLLAQARQGRITQRIDAPAYVIPWTGDKETVTLTALLPVKTPQSSKETNGEEDKEGPGEASLQALLMINYDFTEQWHSINEFRFLLSGAILGILLLLLAVFLFFSRRAESIIARQHEMNLELTAAAASAESENHDKTMFLANISHELRTPLNAIIGFSEILSNELSERLELRHKEYLRDIHSSGKHLLSLINDILEFSKAEAGKLEVDAAEIDVNKMLKNTIRLTIPRAEEGQVTLSEDLPKKSFIMKTDAKKLKQVLLNLISNAVKFTPPNGEVKLWARQDKMREKVVFIVSDTGIGIAPKDISRVMAPFGQVDSKLSRSYEGTGLGLPLSKKLVELLGGTFQIESEENVGTTITIEMPLSIPSNKPDKEAEKENEQ